MLAHFFQHFNSLHRWAIHLDGDEFIHLKRHSDVKQLALEYVRCFHYCLAQHCQWVCTMLLANHLL